MKQLITETIYELKNQLSKVKVSDMTITERIAYEKAKDKIELLLKLHYKFYPAD